LWLLLVFGTCNYYYSQWFVWKMISILDRLQQEHCLFSYMSKYFLLWNMHSVFQICILLGSARVLFNLLQGSGLKISVHHHSFYPIYGSAVCLQNMHQVSATSLVVENFTALSHLLVSFILSAQWIVHVHVHTCLHLFHSWRQKINMFKLE
jgi:hypothetical protein